MSFSGFVLITAEVLLTCTVFRCEYVQVSAFARSLQENHRTLDRECRITNFTSIEIRINIFFVREK